MDLIENEGNIDLEHWYYWRKFEEIRSLFSLFCRDFHTVTDIGSGSGIFVKELAKTYKNMQFVAHDINYEFDAIRDNQLPNLIYSRDFVVADCYLLNDVLEHIENVPKFLQNLVDISPKNAVFIVTVPAFMSLWSGHDVFLKHFRRYTFSILWHEISMVNLQIVYKAYLYWSIFHIVFVFRRFLGKKVVSQMKRRFIVDTLLKIFMFIESKFKISKLPGVSIVVVLKKSF